MGDRLLAHIAKHNERHLWSVAVFAYNEQDKIVACLKSILSETCPANVQVYVLANGCTDETAEVVRQFATTQPALRLVEIIMGDKANAWNVFVHEIALPSAIYFFVDGDVRLDKGAMARLADKLQSSPDAYVVSGVPGSGRGRRKYKRLALVERGVQGNLYCASGEFISRLRARGVRMPVGFVREDGLIGAMAKFDLDPMTVKWFDGRVEVCDGAQFLFEPMSWWRIGDWGKYYRRRIRYSIGHFENRMLREIWRKDGIAGTPVSVTELYKASPPPNLGWRGINTWFDWIAVRRINAKRAT